MVKRGGALTDRWEGSVPPPGLPALLLDLIRRSAVGPNGFQPCHSWWTPPFLPAQRNKDPPGGGGGGVVEHYLLCLLLLLGGGKRNATAYNTQAARTRMRAHACARELQTALHAWYARRSAVSRSTLGFVVVHSIFQIS